MKVLDRIFGWVLAIGGLLHSMGAYAGYKQQPDTLFWAETATLAGLLLAAVNLLRVERPADRTLAWVSFAGCLGWLAVVYFFARLLGNFADFRVLIQGIITLGLAIFSLRSAVGKAAGG